MKRRNHTDLLADIHAKDLNSLIEFDNTESPDPIAEIKSNLSAVKWEEYGSVLRAATIAAKNLNEAEEIIFLQQFLEDEISAESVDGAKQYVELLIKERNPVNGAKIKAKKKGTEIRKISKVLLEVEKEVLKESDETIAFVDQLLKDSKIKIHEYEQSVILKAERAKVAKNKSERSNLEQWYKSMITAITREPKEFDHHVSIINGFTFDYETISTENIEKTRQSLIDLAANKLKESHDALEGDAIAPIIKNQSTFDTLIEEEQKAVKSLEKCEKESIKLKKGFEVIDIHIDTLLRNKHEVLMKIFSHTALKNAISKTGLEEFIIEGGYCSLAGITTKETIK